jgi:hypothetical protein
MPTGKLVSDVGMPVWLTPAIEAWGGVIKKFVQAVVAGTQLSGMFLMTG